MILKKKYIIFILITSIIVLFLLYLFIFKENNYKVYSYETDTNDRFTIVEKLKDNFPDLNYEYEIYNDDRSKQKKLLAKTEGEEFSGIDLIYDDKDLRCYLVSNYFIFKRAGEMEFGGVRSDKLDKNSSKYKFLLPALRRALISDRNLLILVGDTLIKFKDIESIDLIKRFAEGNFTKDESQINRSSDFSDDAVRDICHDLLSDNNYN